MKDSVKMEYVIFDKNLNKAYNGYYTTNYYNKSIFSSFITYYNDCHYLGDHLVLDISLYADGQSPVFVYNSNRIIPLKDNAVSEEFIFKDREFRPLPKKITSLKDLSIGTDSDGNYTYVNPLRTGDEKGFLVGGFNRISGSYEQSIKYYDFDRNFVWEYLIDSITDKKSKLKTRYSYKSADSTRIYAIETQSARKVADKVNLIAQDLATGKKVFEYCIQNDTTPYFHERIVNQIGDTMVVFGRYYNNKKIKKGSDYLGYYRILVDRNGKEIERKYRTWKEISTAEIPLTVKGKINKSNIIHRNSAFLYRDGSVVTANEEYCKRSDLAEIVYALTFFMIDLDPNYTKDAYFMRFNSRFEPIGITKVEKAKSYKLNDFMFSQYHPVNQTAVVCYQSKVKGSKKTEYELSINTIKNDTLTTEKIPLSTENMQVVPIPAKDGYIILNEYNRNEKYNQIRLERLNN
ncbi:MAG: hypothetical protein PHP99_02440 [Paludibacter sp.]|nr:hypothetical protein [Paludibacter sp.]